MVGVAVGVVVGEVVGDVVGDVVGEMVGVGVAPEHVARVMVSASNVTEAVRANTRPTTVTLFSTWMDVDARMFPLKVELVPSVAELPTCQKTLQACALPRRLTLLLDAVMSVDAILKTKTPLGLAWASSVRVPVIWNVPDREL